VEKDLELTINTSITYIVKWLENYLPRSGTNIQYLGEDTDFNPYIRTPKTTADNEPVYLKLVSYPQHTEISDGVIQFSICIQTGSLSQIKNGLAEQDVIPFLKLIEKTPDITVLYLDMSHVDIYAYVKALVHEISIEWPETRRDIQYNDPFDSLVLDKKLLEMTIEAEAKSFINWCHETLSQTHPHILFYQTQDIEVVLQTSFDILPPNQFTNYWEYVVCGVYVLFNRKEEPDKTQIKRNPPPISNISIIPEPARFRRLKRFRPYWKKLVTSEYKQEEITHDDDFIIEEPRPTNLGPIVSIKALQVSEKRLNINGYCEVYIPEITDWLDNLKENIKTTFVIHHDAENPEKPSAGNKINQASQTQRGLRSRGPSIETQERAILFKRYFQKYPSMTPSDLIKQVNADHGTNYTVDDIKNAFIAVGWDYKPQKD
jgi:hypothetical protein